MFVTVSGPIESFGITCSCASITNSKEGWVNEQVPFWRSRVAWLCSCVRPSSSVATIPWLSHLAIIRLESGLRSIVTSGNCRNPGFGSLEPHTAPLSVKQVPRAQTQTGSQNNVCVVSCVRKRSFVRPTFSFHFPLSCFHQ